MTSRFFSALLVLFLSANLNASGLNTDERIEVLESVRAHAVAMTQGHKANIHDDHFLANAALVTGDPVTAGLFVAQGVIEYFYYRQMNDHILPRVREILENFDGIKDKIRVGYLREKNKGRNSISKDDLRFLQNHAQERYPTRAEKIEFELMLQKINELTHENEALGIYLVLRGDHIKTRTGRGIGAFGPVAFYFLQYGPIMYRIIMEPKMFPAVVAFSFGTSMSSSLLKDINLDIANNRDGDGLIEFTHAMDRLHFSSETIKALAMGYYIYQAWISEDYLSSVMLLMTVVPYLSRSGINILYLMFGSFVWFVNNEKVMSNINSIIS